MSLCNTIVNQDPLEPPNWSDTRDATELPPSCLQKDGDLGYVHEHRLEAKDFGEDCLYLNVFQPITGSHKLGVLLFIHGGSHEFGSGLMFDGGYLASHGDIIVVTVNYRLGALGFLGTGQADFRGNYGIMDQIMSMKWVKNNIAFFNGDPDKVTILGHSAGAFDVGLHLLSPLSQGLFRSAISQSGSPSVPVAWKPPRPDPLEEVRYVSHQLECIQRTAIGMKDCMRKSKASDVMKFAYFEHPYAYPFSVIIDGHFLHGEPLQLMSGKRFAANNYVIGVTRSEADRFVNDLKTFEGVLRVVHGYWYRYLPSWSDFIDLIEVFKFEYTNWWTVGQNNSELISISTLLTEALFHAEAQQTADRLSEAGVNVYMYLWDVAPKKSDFYAPWIRVPHGIDLFYLFGSPISGHPNYTFTELDKHMSEYMMSAWSNYVKHGVLSANLTVGSPTYNTDTRSYLRFHINDVYADNEHPDMVVWKNLAPRADRFWHKYLPYQLRRCAANWSVTGNKIVVVVLLGLLVSVT